MDYKMLSGTVLFRGCSQEDIREMLACLGARVRRFGKGETILRAGDTAAFMGLVLSGAVNIEYNDIWGGRAILGRSGPGDMFAETYAFTPGERLMVSVTAAEASEALTIEARRIISSCPGSCAHHAVLVRNLLQAAAQKNLELSRRILHTTPKSIRGRLLSYFSEQVSRSGSCCFTIPFNRQQLADYLGIDRSALSAELSRMRADGLVEYDRSSFSIKCEL